MPFVHVELVEGRSDEQLKGMMADKRWHCSENWKKDFRKITRNGLPQRL